MLALFGVLGLLMGTVPSGYALSCTQCVSLTSTSCTGPSEVCPSGHECGAAYTSTTAAGAHTKIYSMSCAPKNQCHMKGSTSLPNGGRMKMATSCCSTDNCTPTLPSLSPSSDSPNGLTCRSCISAGSTWCYTDETMACTGDENMCMLQTTKITGAKTASAAVRGCATKSICDLGSTTESSGGNTVEVKFSCTNGSAGFGKGFYFPAALCLLLLKFIF